MKGLLRNHYYGAADSALVTLIFIAAIGIALLFSASSILLFVLGMTGAVLISFNAMSSFRKEESSRWKSYIITTPVKRKDVVKCRYIAHLAWVIVGILISFAFIGLTVLIHGNRFFYNPMREPFMVLAIALGIPILMGSIFYPLTYLLGTDKSEVIMIISLGSSIGITVGTIWVLDFIFGFSTLNTIEFLIGLSFYMLLATMLYIISYHVSVRINNKNEY